MTFTWFLGVGYAIFSLLSLMMLYAACVAAKRADSAAEVWLPESPARLSPQTVPVGFSSGWGLPAAAVRLAQSQQGWQAVGHD